MEILNVEKSITALKNKNYKVVGSEGYHQIMAYPLGRKLIRILFNNKNVSLPIIASINQGALFPIAKNRIYSKIHYNRIERILRKVN